MKKSALFLAVAFLAGGFLAGCTDSPAPADTSITPTPTTSPTTTPAPGDGSEDVGVAGNATLPVYARSGCEQLHGVFPAPGLDWGLPEGWGLDSPDGFLTATVYVYPTQCDGNGTAGETWALLGVTPPEALRDPGVDFDYWALTGVLSDEVLVETLRVAGYPVRRGSTELTAQGGVDVWSVESVDGTAYTLTAAVGQPADDDFIVVQRVWTLGPDGEPVALRWVITQSMDRGVGGTTFTAQGDDGAPPLSGGLAHRIGGMSFVAVWDKSTLEIEG